MPACVVWIDSEHAKIFKISPEGLQKKELKHHSVAPHGAHKENHRHNAEEHFFQDVTKVIGHVEELLIFGAGMAKTHFKSHLEKHNAQDLAKHIVGVETLDHVSDNQILEASRKFFKKYNTFNFSI